MNWEFDMSLDGNVVVISGASSGMGRLAAQRFSKQGAKVAALDINETGLQETAAGHENITTFPVNVTDIEQVNSVVADVIAKLGNLDRVFVCAAIMPFGKILDHDAANIKLVMDINYGGTVNITKATVPNMIANGGGDCVIFSSMLGQMPVLMAGAVMTRVRRRQPVLQKFWHMKIKILVCVSHVFAHRL